MSRTFRWILVFCAAILVGLCFAQDGVSTAGAARTKYLGNAGLFPAPRDVVVEDFVNYHRHEIGRPKAGEAVALDVRWGNDQVSGNQAVLQVGLASALSHDSKHIRPLNLSLVIDKSGSMADADKLERVKAALLKLVAQLRPTDILSIVLFDSSAQVLLPAQKLTDREHVMSLIREIAPGSSTNIHAGLMLGYQEAAKHLSKQMTNRVILLTDGIANQGVTDPKSIARDSLGFNDRGIDLSTIGVGLSLNRDLLQDLAKSGRGLFHFISDNEDIEKVFVNELQSLLSPVATDPNLEIEFGPGLALDNVYGYEPKRSKTSVSIKLDNLNSGATEVILMRFKLTGNASKRLPVTVKLSYFDLDRDRRVETVQRTSVGTTSAKADMLEDESVAKNYTIALLAQSIRDMAEACEGKHFRDAENFLIASIDTANRRYPTMQDGDIKRTYGLATKYRDLLREQRKEDGDGDSIIPNGDFSRGNVGFTSDRPYIQPSTNCLWDGNYTIADRFDSPFQLHTNIITQAFSAPKGGRMMYMNSGGSQQFTVWSTKASCKQRTHYRISLQEIGLTRGAEWRNAYEIRINGERSEPQLGGDGQFVTIAYEWDSMSSRTATISLVRLPNAHGGGIIGIGNIEMVPVKTKGL